MILACSAHGCSLRVHLVSVNAHHRHNSLPWIFATQVYKEDLRSWFKSAFAMATSLDEVTAGGAFMGITVYRINKRWQREAHHLALAQLTEAPNAKYLTKTLIDTIVAITGLSLEEVRAKLVNISCDGASVLQGKKSGVVTQVRLCTSAWQGSALLLQKPMMLACFSWHVCGRHSDVGSGQMGT